MLICLFIIFFSRVKYYFVSYTLPKVCFRSQTLKGSFSIPKLLKNSYFVPKLLENVSIFDLELKKKKFLNIKKKFLFHPYFYLETIEKKKSLQSLRIKKEFF